jgi:integrase
MRKKITVTIERRTNGALRLRWKENDQRYQIPLGLLDSVPSRAIAKSIKHRMEEDHRQGIFDESLLRYRPQSTGTQAADPLSSELFQRFTEHKLKEGDITEHTASIAYLSARRLLERRLNKPVSDVDRQSTEALADYLKDCISAQVARQYIRLFTTCWHWARGKYAIITPNPWDDLIGRFKGKRKKPIEPLTKAEVSKVLAGFKAQEPHYHEFAAFLFNTACRIGEAVALRWSSVNTNSVWIGASITCEFSRASTKTGSDRTVPLSPAMASMLAERRERLNPSPDDFVFPNEDGKAISHDIYRYKWKKVLKSVGVPYRKPYISRHTAISHALENGAAPIDIAAQSGHSLDVLLKVYSHVIEKKRVFIDF